MREPAAGTADSAVAPTMVLGSVSGLHRSRPSIQNPHIAPLRPLLGDDRITEIMINGPGQVYVEVGGEIQITDIKFPSEEALIALIQSIAQSVGRQISSVSPLLDARLEDGSRVHAALPPAVLDGPALTIRRFPENPLTAVDLVRNQTVSVEALAFLEGCVRGRANIMISGGTGSGKTTLLNVLSSYIPESERIITIEDAAELRLHQQHVVRMESRPPGMSGLEPITIRELVINALRMRPTRIVVGECRGAEALDMLQAMNTGHDGSLTTLHANTPRDALARVETMVLMAGLDLPLRAIRHQVSSALNLIVQTERMQDGGRRIVRIVELVGMEGDTIALQDVFQFEGKRLADGSYSGGLVPTEIRPMIVDRLYSRRIPIPAVLARLYPDRPS